MIVGATSLTRKGQVTIPRAVRARLGLRAGDKVVFELREEEAVLRRSGESVVEILQRSGPWGVDPVGFQRKLRSEWKR